MAKGATAEELINELVEEALAPYAALVPADVLAFFRGELEDALATHPHGAMLLRRALPDPSAQKSGEVERDASDSSPAGGKTGAGGG